VYPTNALGRLPYAAQFQPPPSYTDINNIERRINNNMERMINANMEK